MTCRLTGRIQKWTLAAALALAIDDLAFSVSCFEAAIIKLNVLCHDYCR